MIPRKNLLIIKVPFLPAKTGQNISIPPFRAKIFSFVAQLSDAVRNLTLAKARRSWEVGVFV